MGKINVNKKQQVALKDLLSRQDYLVTQANDLSKSFGNLNLFEHKILDYCFSFVKRDNTLDTIFTVNAIDVIHHLGLSSQGRNYKRIANAFKKLNENTALYLAIYRNGQRGIRMTQLFSHIDFYEDGKIEFQFSQQASPYVFQLRKHFYSFKLSELSQVKSKHTLTLMKLWNANSLGHLKNATISGTLKDWENWFLGNKHVSAGIFKRDVLKKSVEELSKLYPQTNLILTTKKDGRKVIGYQLDISQT